MNTPLQTFKQQAAEYAVETIQSGMVIGLGSGSTAIFAVRRLSEMLHAGTLSNIVGIPTSQQTAEEARRLEIPLTSLDDHPHIDITIDGADEIDPKLNAIKGGGGALLHEKIVAKASRILIIVIDESKMSPVLGKRWAVPVEVIPFGWRLQADYLASLGAQLTLRRQADNTPFQTDEGNYILDCDFGEIADPYTLAERLKARTGIVEHGLFLDLAGEVIVAGTQGIRRLRRS